MIEVHGNEEEDHQGMCNPWGAFLMQAIRDLHPRRGWTKNEQACRNKQEAERWFNSPSKGVGSFLWICGLLNLDADQVRGMAKRQSFRWYVVRRPLTNDTPVEIVSFKEIIRHLPGSESLSLEARV